jgi:hypothetical protein
VPKRVWKPTKAFDRKGLNGIEAYRDRGKIQKDPSVFGNIEPHLSREEEVVNI